MSTTTPSLLRTLSSSNCLEVLSGGSEDQTVPA